MSSLFQPYDFCGLQLYNRFVRSATVENMVKPERLPSSDLLDLYEDLARGGVGLIITSATRPDRTWDWRPDRRCMAIDEDAMIPEFMKLTARVHAHGSKIAMQLAPCFQYEGELVSPSGVPFRWAPGVTPKVLEVRQIAGIVKSSGEAAARAREAGFDAVQLHVAHGYLLCSFLSPLFNQRDDEYGGGPEKRARLILEIKEAIQDRAGGDFPVFIKMNVADFCEGGMALSDAVHVSKILTGNGIAAIETSGGASGHEVTPLGPVDHEKWSEGYFMEYAEAIKAEVDVPVILVGGLRDPSMMARIIDQGKADLISMSRPFLNEPAIVKRWREGDLDPSGCISCNGCMDLLNQGEVVRCIL
jgi:2,4-dienoyl-CoA reductase-like NADH-dependent reductase (Old Yellow Enzyme family)